MLLRAHIEPTTFYEQKTVLWSSSATATNDDSSTSPPSLEHTSLYTWPFMFFLPSEIELPPGEVIKAPPTYTARDSPVYIDYKVIVTFKRGALRGDQT